MEDMKEKFNIFYEVCEKEEPSYSFDNNEENLAGNDTNCENVTVSCKSEDVKNEPPEDYAFLIDSKDVSSIPKREIYYVKNTRVKQDRCLDLDNTTTNLPLISLSDLVFCEHCEFSTKFRGNLQRHIRRVHLGITDSLKYRTTKRYQKCVHCSFKSNSLEEMKLHNTYKHNGAFKFTCYFCNYGINKKISLLDHIFKKHESESVEGSFGCLEECTHCDFTTDFKDEMLDHILSSHKKSKSVEYCCKLCSRVCKSRHDLLKHIDGFHKKIRPYACLLCDYSASAMSDLKIHISAKHNKITPFKCEKCNYASAYKKHLRRHILTRHTKIKNNKKPGKSKS